MIKALVIDDIRVSVDVLCQLLSLLDIEAIPAYGSRAALTYLIDHIPDVVFVDLNMPGLGGYEVMGYLRREPRLEHVPIFVVTSDDQAETAEKAKSAGALDVIVKPASYETIEESLKKAGLI